MDKNKNNIIEKALITLNRMLSITKQDSINEMERLKIITDCRYKEAEVYIEYATKHMDDPVEFFKAMDRHKECQDAIANDVKDSRTHSDIRFNDLVRTLGPTVAYLVVLAISKNPGSLTKFAKAAGGLAKLPVA